MEMYTKKLLHQDASIISLEENHWPWNQYWIESWGAKRFPPLVIIREGPDTGKWY